MKIVWAPQAEEDRALIWHHIAHDSPQAANRLDHLFGDAVERLSQFPLMGHPGLVPGTRELLPHPSYRLVYAIKDDVIRVLALVHTWCRWPAG